MDENIVDFEDYDVAVDVREIENMDREEIEKCKQLIKEIEEKIEG